MQDEQHTGVFGFPNLDLSSRSLYITILIIRLAMGWLFLQAGIDKLTEGFSARGFLEGATGPLAGFYHSLGTNQTLLPVINNLVMWGEVLIGATLILGLLVRFASFWGIIMMLLYYLPSLPPSSGWITQQIMYIFIFVVFMLSGVGYFIGLDRLVIGWERTRRWPRIFFG